MVELHKLPDESEEQFIWRVGQAKDAGTLDMGWDEIADIINIEYRDDESEYRNESAYRKPYQSAKRYYEANVFKALTSEAYLMALKLEKQELAIEKQKLRDERVDYQRSLREAARKESFIELIERTMAKSVEPLEYVPSPKINSEDDMVVCLSDLHVGIDVQNWWNAYNTKILKDRLCKYIDEIKAVQAMHQCKRCDIVLGGDNISG